MSDKTTQPEKIDTLADALPREIERVQELIPLYKAVPMGFLAAGMMLATIKEAHRAMMHGDVIEMLRCLESLKGYEA